MKLTIGCPVYERAWCLPLWFDCIEAQKLDKISDDITFCFAYSPGFDGTFDILENRASNLGEVRIYQYDTPTYSDRDLSRIPMLAQLRNALLEMVRETEPDYFLSWDDDVLFRPGTLGNMWQMAAPDVAVGAFMDMGGNDAVMAHPSVMHFPQALGEMAFRRPFTEYDWSEPFACDIIMAVKLMGKEVLNNCEYAWDPVGEDIGWCMDVANKGYKRIIHPGVRGIHLYDKNISVQVMKRFPKLNYPEILGPLSRWYEPPADWREDPW